MSDSLYQCEVEINDQVVVHVDWTGTPETSPSVAYVKLTPSASSGGGGDGLVMNVNDGYDDPDSNASPRTYQASGSHLQEVSLSGGHGTITLNMRAFASTMGPSCAVSGSTTFSAALDTRCVHILPAWTDATYFRGDQVGTLDWDPEYTYPDKYVPDYERKLNPLGQSSVITLGLDTMTPGVAYYAPNQPSPDFTPYCRYSFSPTIIGGQPPTASAPHKYAWTCELRVDDGNPPLSGSLPDANLDPTTRPPSVKTVVEHPFSLDGKTYAPGDSGTFSTLTLTYTWNDGVMCKANAYVSLHAEDDDCHKYGNIKHEIYDPDGHWNQWVTDPEWTHNADTVTGTVDAEQEWYIAGIEDLKTTIEVAAIFIPECRLLKVLDLLGIVLPVVFKEPERLEVPRPTEAGFNDWWRKTYGVDHPSDEKIVDYDYMAFRVVYHDCELWYASHYDINGYSGPSRLTKEVYGGGDVKWKFVRSHPM